MIVLDTHAWIWLMEGDPKMEKEPILRKLYRHIPHRGIYISEISGWEVGMLIVKKRIQISGTLNRWLQDAYTAPGIQPYRLTPEVIVESVNLPDSFHGDPADRIIVATARVLNAELVTKDKEIIKYGKKGNLKVISI
ncbi:MULTISPECIES: type II toxin-antitoxin system VapC family toxin [unclassified Leptospira]|uniref:type II toxin-antitoxin system VapC family toxin n=1 Tax=unclassified Leptospira TaxID=2633828 RepID=UPI00056351E5|nr:MULTISPECIES: type II toxin-antitoxin system VapC family toxin [unclassified Leptospira]MCR1793170.1 type II toxin-antitoxin system VapC family toxin [Leptospira sp. id769339]